jgi:hypothetical protein
MGCGFEKKGEGRAVESFLVFIKALQKAQKKLF